MTGIDWIDSLLKVVFGMIIALVPVWVATIAKRGSLAESLRLQEESIRQYLNDELRKMKDRLGAEEARCNQLQLHLTKIHRLIRITLDKVTLHQDEDLPLDFVLLLNELDSAESNFMVLPNDDHLGYNKDKGKKDI